MPISTHGTGECSVALSPLQTDATLLANNSQHCWMLYVCPFANPVVSCCKLLRVVGSCCAVLNRPNVTTPNIVELLRPLARSFTLLHLQQ